MEYGVWSMEHSILHHLFHTSMDRKPAEDSSYAFSLLRPKRVGILWVYGSQVGYIGKENSRILGELCSFRAFLQCYELPSFRVLKRLKTVKDNPAEPMVVKNWETVDVARLVKIENAFQDSIVVDGWGWEETNLENSGDDMDYGCTFSDLGLNSRDSGGNIYARLDVHGPPASRRLAEERPPQEEEEHHLGRSSRLQEMALGVSSPGLSSPRTVTRPLLEAYRERCVGELRATDRGGG
ncbi:hypothetical protein EDB80DRAFT_829272 [Ilyonectria destructans]|nr:hypothetical protein EDB80DRAFT_829272 [Ilyonectria destructans]